MITRTFDAKVVVECEFYTRPGAKKCYQKKYFTIEPWQQRKK